MAVPAAPGNQLHLAKLHSSWKNHHSSTSEKQRQRAAVLRATAPNENHTCAACEKRVYYTAENITTIACKCLEDEGEPL